MKPVSFDEHSFTIARSGEEIPAHLDEASIEFTLTICWQLSIRERIKLLFTGRLWHQVHTFGHALQPQTLAINKPALTTTDGK